MRDRKTWKDMGRRAVSVITACVMLAAPCIQPAGTLTVRAAAAESPDAAEDLDTVEDPNIAEDLNATEDPNAAAGAGNTEENVKNAMSAEDYKKFGLVTDDPDEFSEQGDPLEDFEPTYISELYVGQMNKDKSWTGDFKVMNDTKEISKDAFNLYNMEKDMVGGPFDFVNWYERNKDQVEVQTSNSCAIDYDGDGTDEILNVTLCVQKKMSDDPKSRSRLDVRLADLSGGQWRTVGGGTPYSFYLADRSSSDAQFVWEIEADSSKAYAAVAAGDYDGDGKEEAAVYVPTKEGNAHNPYVVMLECDTNGKWTELSRVYVSDLNSNISRFDYKYNNRDVAVVSLATTHISGHDDLVVNVSHPLKSVDGNGQASAMGIYRLNGHKLDKLYKQVLYYGGDMRMRFVSAVDGDVDGNGVQELIVGGYKNNGWKQQNDVGHLDSGRNYINLVTWDQQRGRYEDVWAVPQEVEARGGLKTDLEMTEPAALAAGALHTNNKREQVFLEGVLFDFHGEDTTAASEAERLRKGSFSKEYTMPLEGGHSAFISSAYAAKFSTAGGTAEQLVVLSGDHKQTDNDVVYYDVGWMWEMSATRTLTGEITNNDYIHGKDEDDNGTFISLCPLDVDEDSVKLRYKGKTCGWSDPVLYSVLQSPPYWNELQYNSESFGTGEVSYEISYGSGSGKEGEWGVGLGVHVGASVLAGGGILGNSVMMGAGLALEAMGEYVGSYATEHKVEESYEMSAAAGEDYAVLMAVPIVAYQYEMWMPDQILTEDDIKNLQDVYKDDPQYYDKYKDLKAGDLIPGHWEETEITSTLEPSFSHMTLEGYNELAREYKKKGLKEVTESMLASKTIGDPSTYPHSKEDLKAPGNIDDKNLYISGKSTMVNIGEAETRFSYGTEDGSELKNGLNLSFGAELSAILEAEVELFAAAKVEGEFGSKFELEGGASWISTNSKGTGFAAVVKDLPKGTSEDYRFGAKMAVFIPKGLPTGDGSSDGVYVLGYVVEGIDGESAPPKLPVDLRVFGAAEHKVALKWEASDYRPAKSYEIFVEDNVTKEPRSIGRTENTYFIAQSLEPSTEYNFAVRSYSDLGLASCMSRWVRAHTKASTSTAPMFTRAPENVVIHVPGDTGGHVLEAEAVKGEGMEDAVLTYQWQQYDRDTLTQDGIWSDIPGAVENTYALPTVTQDNVNEYPEQIHYRVVATQTRGANVLSAVSKTATLFIDREGTGRSFHETATDVWMGQVIGETGYYVKTVGESAECRTEVKDRDNNGVRPYSGDVLLAVCQEGQESILYRTGFSGSNGQAAVDVSGLPRGQYAIYAVYPGGLSGGGDTENYFLPSQSDPIQLHVVDTYQIRYHLDGGKNDPSNPSVVTNESPAVQIGPAKKDGYTFGTYWYLDEACTNPLPDNTLDPQALTGDVDLYAKWEPVYYAISYVLNGGENHPENPSSYKTDDKNIELKEAARPGYDFKGWYRDEACTQGPVRYFAGEEASDLTFYAKWEPVVYTIAYEMGGGRNDPANPVSYTVEDGEVRLLEPVYEDHIFRGWYGDGAFSQGPFDSFSASSAEDKTFYAKWEEEIPPLPRDPSGAYEVGSYEDLVVMAEMVQSDPDKYAAASYVQTDNINCGGRTWDLTIGTKEKPFEGRYEGNDYYVMYLQRDGGEVGGLFGVIGTYGVVRDLSVVDLDYISQADTAGGLAGINNGRIIGCGSGVNISSDATIFRDGKPVPISSLNSDIRGASYGGGLVGCNHGLIQDSSSNAAVTGENAGGIAGENTGTILNVYNTGKVDGGENAGGIVGKNTADGHIRYGYDSQAVTGKAAGGIAGYSEGTDIQDLWYPSGMAAACANQPDSSLAVARKEAKEMARQGFCDILNETIAGEKESAGLRDWVWSESKNEGYPMLGYNILQQQTLSHAKTGIQVSGKIHPGAQLKLVKLSDGHQDLKTIKKSLRSGSYVKGWHLALQYANGTYATWEGELSVSITSDLIDDIQKLRLVQVDEDGKFREVGTDRKGKILTVRTDTLGSFSLVRTGPKTSQKLINKYASLKKSVGAAKVTQSVSGAMTKVTFTSSDPKVASVDKKGRICFLRVGTAYITSHAAEDENYRGASAKCKVTVRPKTAGIRSAVSKKKGQIHIKSDKKAKGNTGYEIQYRIKGQKKVHKLQVKSRTILDQTLRGLRSGKRVRVRIRAYKTVKGKKYYGLYSKYKTVTVK